MRFPEPDLDDLFLFETKRKVRTDRTVSLDGTIYEVDAALVGERITLRYDPTASTTKPVQVHHNGAVELAKPVDLYANCFVKRNRPSQMLDAEKPAASRLSLRSLCDDTNKEPH